MSAKKPTSLERAPAIFAPLTISVDAATDFIGLPRSTVYELVDAGEFETIRVGKRRLILFASLVKFIERQPLAEITPAQKARGRAALAARRAKEQAA